VGHCSQFPPSVPVKPALHMQDEISWLATGEMELVGHISQVVSFIAYVPPGHAKQPADSNDKTLHCATNPDWVTLESEVKTTCKYPVEDMYVASKLTELPESCAHRSTEVHNDDEQRFSVTKSEFCFVLNEENESEISLLAVMSHLQFALSP